MPTEFFMAVYAVDALWLAWVVYWAISALYVKRTVYRQRGPERWFYMLFIVGGIFGMRWPVLRIWLVYPNLITEISGVVLCAAGLGFSVWARVHLGRNWSGFVTLKEDHQLIRTGPYRFVRHPIYTGILLAIFGTVLALTPSIGGVLCLILVTVGFMVKWGQEEKLMLQQFPEEYPAYKRQTPAILPRPW